MSPVPAQHGPGEEWCGSSAQPPDPPLAAATWWAPGDRHCRAESPSRLL